MGAVKAGVEQKPKWGVTPSTGERTEKEVVDLVRNKRCTIEQPSAANIRMTTQIQKKYANSREVEVDAEEIVDANSDVDNGENEEIRCERPPQNHGIKKELIERCKM
jgi:hypothetical protein